ncbi:hypothetical protein HY492_02355 [Candidatus Woesearchaeota archaeon]|nr:hypothetical protein [Candidatus Woesearchaeota archaeon]
MKKGIIIGVIVLVLLVGLGSAFMVATGSSTVKAQLHVEDGTATVNGKDVSGNTKLSEGDVIATDGHATVILYESVLVSLEPGAKVTLDELAKTHPQVSQQEGRSISTFTKLAGVEQYSIKTDSTVASVRGTLFAFEDGYVLTGEGSVSVAFNGEGFTINAGRVIEDGVERDATAEEMASIQSFIQRAIQELRFLRQQELDKHPILVSTAKSMYGIDDAGINAKLEAADRGEIDIDEAKAQSPLQLDSLDKIADITKAIQQLSAELG